MDEEHEILHLSPHAGRYLQFVGGEPSHNLLRSIRPELRLEVRTALYQAAQRRTSVQAHGLSLRVSDAPETVTITVKPVLRSGDPARGFFLVLFEEGAAATAAVAEAVEPAEGLSDAAIHLEQELGRLKEHLDTSVEQGKTKAQTEELKSSNEELQASNEELPLLRKNGKPARRSSSRSTRSSRRSTRS